MGITCLERHKIVFQLISDLLLESHDSGVENTSDFKPSSLSFSEQSAPLNCSSLIPSEFDQSETLGNLKSEFRYHFRFLRHMCALFSKSCELVSNSSFCKRGKLYRSPS